MKLPKTILDKLIPEAIALIRITYIDSANINNPIIISSTEKGYANAFGANMVMNSPLMAAILLENNEKASKVYSLLLEVLKKQNPTILAPNLSTYLESLNGIINSKIRTDLALASVALKMALRTFPSPKNAEI